MKGCSGGGGGGERRVASNDERAVAVDAGCRLGRK